MVIIDHEPGFIQVSQEIQKYLYNLIRRTLETTVPPPPPPN